ncbi:MAG TPA: hypothetical protein VNA04_01350 [Thermoanaerobaculia bacterium]|nr:hypothetical protein [Thermoanaerobaculia bacterium]
MSRWLWRMAAIVMLLIFLLMFAHLQRRLVDLQQTRGPAPAQAR